MKDYFLIPIKKNKEIYKLKVCAAIAKVLLYHGNKYDEKAIHQYWAKGESIPSSEYISRNVSHKNIKWYINNQIEVTDKVWNADFLYGLSKCGRLAYKKKCMPTFIWYSNPIVYEILGESPFFGKRGFHKNNSKDKQYYDWAKVAAFFLKHSEETLSFMAGVMATGQKEAINKETYVKYNKRTSNLLKQWKIPIEKEGRLFDYFSPFWVAIFTPWMPSCCQQWLNIKNPFRGEEYAMIMWRIFFGKEIKTNGIPFLASRRTYYYKYGSIKHFEKKWVENKLVEIDPRIKEVMMEWGKKCIITPETNSNGE